MRLVVTLSLAFLAFMFTSYSEAENRPNVLFIISDDLTAEAPGSYGNAQCNTPNIDRLATQGVRFTRTYCQFPICGPSRAAIMSRLYPENTGIMSNGMSERFEGVLGERPSLVEYFRVNGYNTALVSKIYHMRVSGGITAGVDGPNHVESWSKKNHCQGPEWNSSGEYEHLSNERLSW